MIGKTLSHYRILEKIGAGGMGEVYRARDEHLGRDVAIKVLPAGTLADESSRKRFRKEALALSKLNHPNIETVYDFDTQDGVDFLVMEHISGVTLSDRLQSGPLLEKEVTRLGMQLAEGLEAAHKEKVVHRDIKPGNLRVTPEGRLKVLDFGLAKLVRPVSETAPTESLTETQAAAGTLPYMAPEQVRAETVDERTDLYAVGAVLYEMSTGQRAFAETQAGRLMDAILHTAPVAPTRFQPRLSGELERIILKCLEKDPEDRYQSARDLLVDCRRLTAPEGPRVIAEPRRRLGWLVRASVAVLIVAVLGVAGYFAWQRYRAQASPPAGKIMLAVLPFDNMSADPEQEYFSDGMTEEMIAELGHLQPERLGVIARTSAMRYKGTDKGIDQIGEELGVDYILEGSVRHEGDRVRITAQLIQVSDQTHLWAETYEQELEGVFAIQSEVAGRVARSLALELLPAEQEHLASPRRVNPAAREAYLKGRYFWNQRTREELIKGIDFFQQAIEIDPTHALAYAGLADSYYLLATPEYAAMAPRDGMPKAKAAALKALEIDDTLAEPHVTLAAVRMDYDWNLLGAEREFKRALELNPGYPTAHHWYAYKLIADRRYEEAIAEIMKARELDPLSLIISADVGYVLLVARRYDQAIHELRKTIEMDVNFAVAHWNLGLAYEQKAMYAEAIAEFEKAMALSRGSSVYMAALGHAYAASERRAEALKIVRQLKESAERRYIPPLVIAVVYAGLGGKSEAFDWLEKAYEERTTLPTTLGVDPRFDPLRSDPRFQDLLRRMNFPE